jgi:transcriptional regulator with XRE-family HTH domain
MTQLSHWTEKSTEDFLYRIAADFVRQIEKAMEAAGINQAELAKRLGVTEGRVSQVLNNPGNLTLKKIVEYVRALGHKVSIVEYNDGDASNVNGPVNAEIFAACWNAAGMPSDFVALESATTTAYWEIRPMLKQTYFPVNPRMKAANDKTQSQGLSKSACTTEVKIGAL